MTPDKFIFQAAINKVNPSLILEVGFFQGDSAKIMLDNSIAKVVSVDPLGGNDHRATDVPRMQAEYKERFIFIQKSIQNQWPSNFLHNSCASFNLS